jgi:tRNA dimethylallyltransferase
MITKHSPETGSGHCADRPALALIAGPTASGKSDLAIRLASALVATGRHAVIINADSAQVYADLAVLSARPSPAEMAGIEHRLFGEWDGAMACSAADWAARAAQAIAEVHGAGAVPILVGGTGLYLRTLLDGIAPIPDIDRETRAEVRALPVDQAYRALLREDPARAAKLAPTDSTRVARALEVVRSTGRTLTDWQRETSGGIGGSVTLHPAVVLPPRAWLYPRCDARFAQMVARGAVAEVEALLARGLDPALPVMRAIGVAEIAGYLCGQYGLEHAQALGSQATRQYAKRQYTWFRRQPPLDWPRLESQNYQIKDIFASLFHT